MQTEELKRYLGSKVQLVQDHEVLLAIKTIVDKHLEGFANAYKAQPITKEDQPPLAASETGMLEDIPPLKEAVQEEEKEQQIEDWLKEL